MNSLGHIKFCTITFNEERNTQQSNYHPFQTWKLHQNSTGGIYCSRSPLKVQFFNRNFEVTNALLFSQGRKVSALRMTWLSDVFRKIGTYSKTDTIIYLEKSWICTIFFVKCTFIMMQLRYKDVPFSVSSRNTYPRKSKVKISSFLN